MTEMNEKLNDDEWMIILHDTWYHNEYYEIMRKLLYKKYPLARHESHASVWAETIVKSEEEMREIIKELEDYWKGHLRELLDTISNLTN